MTIETEAKAIPNGTEVRCPQCGQVSHRMDATKDIYECPNCTLQFEALIELSWDSKHYTRKH